VNHVLNQKSFLYYKTVSILSPHAERALSTLPPSQRRAEEFYGARAIRVIGEGKRRKVKVKAKEDREKKRRDKKR